MTCKPFLLVNFIFKVTCPCSNRYMERARCTATDVGKYSLISQTSTKGASF